VLIIHRHLARLRVTFLLSVTKDSMMLIIDDVHKGVRCTGSLRSDCWRYSQLQLQKNASNLSQTWSSFFNPIQPNDITDTDLTQHTHL